MQTNTCSATRTLEITGDNSKENLFRKQPSDALYQNSVLIQQNSQESTCTRASFSIKLRVSGVQLYQKETLVKEFFCEFFKNTFFEEHLQMTASDIRLQVVVIYNSNLALQFVTTNFTFSLLRVFTLAHALHNVPQLLHRFAFWYGYFKPCLARPLLKRNNYKDNIQKPHIQSFRNKLLGELTVIQELSLKFSDSIRTVLQPTL